MSALLLVELENVMSGIKDLNKSHRNCVFLLRLSITDSYCPIILKILYYIFPNLSGARFPSYEQFNSPLQADSAPPSFCLSAVVFLVHGFPTLRKSRK